MALRAEKQVPSVYFGKPGAYFELPWPAGGMEKPYEKQVFDFPTGSGFHQVSQLMGGSRLYSLKWDALHIDNYAKLQQYFVGANGPGPYVLLDPSEPNLLPANVAAACSLYKGGRDFTSNNNATEGQVVANTNESVIHRPHADTCIKWLFTGTAVATPTLGVAGLFRSWYGTPALAGQAYTWSSWMRTDPVDTAITASMTMEFLNSSGASLGAPTSSGNVSLNTNYQRVSVTATAPAGTAYVRPRWQADGTTIAVGGSVLIDEPLLEYGSVLNDWAPASGIRPVQIVGLTEAVPFSTYMRQDIQLQLREMTK
jgi:hypothetical protein